MLSAVHKNVVYFLFPDPCFDLDSQRNLDRVCVFWRPVLENIQRQWSRQTVHTQQLFLVCHSNKVSMLSVYQACAITMENWSDVWKGGTVHVWRVEVLWACPCISVRLQRSEKIELNQTVHLKCIMTGIPPKQTINRNPKTLQQRLHFLFQFKVSLFWTFTANLQSWAHHSFVLLLVYIGKSSCESM